MMTAPVRLPVQFATYPRDCTGILLDGPKGPNTLTELLYPVTAEYDAESDTTRVGFSYIAPPDPDPVVEMSRAEVHAALLGRP